MKHMNRLQRILVSNIHMGIASRVLGTDMPCTQNPCPSLLSLCEECIGGSMRYITSSYMATAFGSRPPWSSLHGPSEDSTASLNTRVLQPKTE